MSQIPQKMIQIDSSQFGLVMNTSDNTIQKALNKIDTHTHAAYLGFSDCEKLYYGLTSSNSYAYRNGVPAYDYLFTNGKIVAMYTYNMAAASSFTLQIRKNGITTVSLSVAKTERMKTLTGIEIACNYGDYIGVYCSGSRPTNGQVILIYDIG